MAIRFEDIRFSSAALIKRLAEGSAPTGGSDSAKNYSGNLPLPLLNMEGKLTPDELVERLRTGNSVDWATIPGNPSISLSEWTIMGGHLHSKHALATARQANDQIEVSFGDTPENTISRLYIITQIGDSLIRVGYYAPEGKVLAYHVHDVGNPDEYHRVRTIPRQPLVIPQDQSGVIRFSRPDTNEFMGLDVALVVKTAGIFLPPKLQRLIGKPLRQDGGSGETVREIRAKFGG